MPTDERARGGAAPPGADACPPADSDGHYRVLFHRNPLPLLVLDETSLAFLDVNDAALAQYGYTREEFLRLTAADLRPAAQREAFRRWMEAQAPATTRSAETQHVTKAGKVIDVEIVAHPISHEGRTALLVIATDMTARNAAQRERAAAHATLEAIVRASEFAIAAVDAEGRITMWNDAAQAMFGWTAEEVLGNTVPPRLMTGMMHEYEYIANELAAGRSVAGFETHRTRKDGSTVDVMLSATMLTGPDGTRIGDVVMFSDISERRNSEREREQLLHSLEFERNRLAATFHQAPSFIVVLRGPDHVIEMANEAYYRIVGRRDLVGRPARDALPELVSTGLEAALDRVLKTGEPYVASRMPIAVQRTPGGPLEERFLDFVYQPFEEADGTRSGVIAQGIDVTEQVHAAATLRESEERYRSLVELSPDGIVIHDGRVVRFVNAAAMALVGAGSTQDVVGQPILRFIHDDSRDAAIARIASLQPGTMPIRSVQRWVNLQGVASDVEVTSMAVSLGGEQMVQTVFRDITERRHLEEQLRQSQKMEGVGQLAGGIAHDFNNLLMVIRANTEFLLEDLDHADPRRAEVLEIRTAADRAVGMTRQLLAFSRKQILAPRPVDLRDIVAGVKSMLARTIGEDITVETRSMPSVGLVMADPGQVEQVLMNLVLNSRDAMPHGGRILIETADVTLDAAYATGDRSVVTPGDYVMLSVSDTGEGMSEATRARIFEPFFTTKPVGQGTGLGLATVYGIIKQSGAHIWVYSEPGNGTVFKAYFPRLGSERAAAAVTAAAETPARGTETVLLVEDEEALRTAARRMLTRQGYTVLEARNGRDAMAVAMRHAGPIHLMLTDVVMPEMSGGALAERLQGVRPETRILYMSGYTDGDIVRRGVLRHGMSFLQKPFTVMKLAEMVRKTLDQP